MSNDAKLLFIFGQHTDGCVDVSDGDNDVLEHVPRSVAEAVIKWTDEQAKISDEWRDTVVGLRNDLSEARDAVSQLRTLLQIARIFVEGKALVPDQSLLLSTDLALADTKKQERR